MKIHELHTIAIYLISIASAHGAATYRWGKFKGENKHEH
jgi:hypothetical protein